MSSAPPPAMGAPAESAPAAANAPTTVAGLEIAPPAEETPLTRDESLHEPRVELPGVPPYPNARSLALTGIGPVMTIGNASTATYSVTASALDVATFYRKVLGDAGWTETFEGLRDELTHSTPLAVLLFTRGEQTARIAYQDGLSGKDVTGPRLSVMASGSK